MFKTFATRLLQHLLSQNIWTFVALQPFAGKSVQFRIAPITTTLVVLENGSLAIADESNKADAIVTISPSIALRLLAKDESAKTSINIEGDTHLATELSKVLQGISWDYEEDLSKLTGDITANKLGQWARDTTSGLKKQSINVAEMVSEYLQEEVPTIAKKRHIEHFLHEVDTLRESVERFEKRLNKLAEKMNSKHA